MRNWSARSLLCFGLTLGAQGPAAHAAEVPLVDAPVAGAALTAVWREQHVQFLYMGRTSRYSCDGLRDKVRAMLLDLGARRDLKMTAVGCEAYGSAIQRPSTPSLSIVFSAPAIMDSAAKPAGAEDRPTTDARFEMFTMTNDAFRNMGVGDCELVEEFARQILTKLVTRHLQQDITCVPYQQSGSHFLVKGEVLRSVTVH